MIANNFFFYDVIFGDLTVFKVYIYVVMNHLLYVSMNTTALNSQ